MIPLGPSFAAGFALSALPLSAPLAPASLSGPGAVLLADATVQAAPAHEFTEEEVAERAKAIVAEHAKDGVLVLRDPRTGVSLDLVFDEVKLVRGIKGEGWFPNLIFHDRAVPAKKYAVDLWLMPEADRLVLLESRVQKEPIADGASWTLMTREPIAWWWLPTLQRASVIGSNRPWNVMAAVHRHIAAAREGELYEFKDEAGSRKLELIDVELPVLRRKADGRFVVCAGFRDAGGQDGFFDISFELDSKSGAVKAESGRARANPMQAGDEASQTRCDFKHLDAEVVQ